jgi:hypothetical protein
VVAAIHRTSATRASALQLHDCIIVMPPISGVGELDNAVKRPEERWQASEEHQKRHPIAGY